MTTPLKPIFIYGRHALASALSHKPASVQAVFLDPSKREDKFWKDLLSQAQSKKVASGGKFEIHDFEPDNLPKEALAQLPDFGTHQGCLAKIDTNLLLLDGKNYIKNFEIKGSSCFIILGEITDVQNVGSIIRSASGLGVDGVIVPEHNQAQITGTVVKISAGNAFTIPLLSVGNVNQTIELLKDKGFWVYGLDSEGGNLYKEEFSKPSAFVVGSEDVGLREKTQENCDQTLSIPLDPRCESLNAAVSAAIVISEYRRQKPF